ncbi:hypothetical protein [Rhodococcus sp. BP-316]|nr:hypothetical protein [Rhodococcus sp. BP-316]
MIDPAVIRAVVDEAPALTAEQRDRLSTILRAAVTRPVEGRCAA